MALEDITNHIRISDRIASSGQPNKLEFKDIAQAGFEVVINLAMPDSENAIPEEEQIVTTQNMQYIHIPVPFEAPTPEHLKEFISMMKRFKDKKVWVHCVVNYRVSAFLFLYLRLVNNATIEEASKVIVKSWKPNDIWKRFMEHSNQEKLL